MIREERLQIILDHVSKDQRVLLTELSEHLNVSEDTIRRDIKVLADQNLLTAVRGGAVAHSPIPHHFRAREKHDVASKNVIASKALSFLKEGQVVLFDGGTSTLAVAKSIPLDLKITVVTNSFPVANALEDHPAVEVIFAGGRLYKSSFTTVGHETIQAFRNIRADLCLFGVCSIHPTIGLTTRDYEEAEIKKIMISVSKQTIALSTIEKINTADSYYICPVTELDTIITDVSPTDEQLLIYKEAGITII
ncbi:DeoR/GlpR family DNA-binding transcription regulator [Mucilaginibacter sp. FT3.2]|uniref:DeoR/GlpR family DNA-binding transcription regulator n=1 Tax=Mucilaginibacter sp. FT3.2 TaxID=2723090 RepID=UPI0016224518|nr:DeoR/GlpR family DNA-binding transcription regulator [Mucilaginibacter sp. FT3.2]MBB6229690.1 DeoR/GlpR family transcriptional regulator of sugar metabolism [Mucilaginibacter sp. FT3.2]